MSPASGVGVTSDPRTIWPLQENERPIAVIEILKVCAAEFNDAVRRDNAGDAQDMVIHALSSVAGLFPDPNDDVHEMFRSLVSVFLAAKWGGHRHILLRASSPILGTKKGYGHAILGGFAISAFNALTDGGAMSGREARKAIAQMLAEAGCSLKAGDHGAEKSITSSAIRNWIELPDTFPAQHMFAAEMVDIHAENLERRAATTKDQVIAYFRSYAREMVELSRTI